MSIRREGQRMSTVARARALPVLVGVAALVAACSGGGDGSDGAGGDGSAGEVGVAPSEVETFSGSVDAFYAVPDDFASGEPGDLIRTMPVDAPAGERACGSCTTPPTPRATTGPSPGSSTPPTGDAPEGGWPIVAWAHGTSGLAAPCAPSRNPCPPPAFGVAGRAGRDRLRRTGPRRRAAPLPLRRRRGPRGHRRRRRGPFAPRGPRGRRLGRGRCLPRRARRAGDQRDGRRAPAAGRSARGRRPGPGSAARGDLRRRDPGPHHHDDGPRRRGVRGPRRSISATT